MVNVVFNNEYEINIETAFIVNNTVHSQILQFTIILRQLRNEILKMKPQYLVLINIVPTTLRVKRLEQKFLGSLELISTHTRTKPRRYKLF